MEQSITAAKLAQLDVILQRAADLLGDITAPVMARFYRNVPDARAGFAANSLHDRDRLETEMVAMVVYCLMSWIDRPSEIEIILTHTVPHHTQTLNIAPAAFRGLVETVDHVIAETIPADAPADRAAWAEIAGGLLQAIDTAGAGFRRAGA